jgi:hypothetical protein
MFDSFRDLKDNARRSCGVCCQASMTLSVGAGAMGPPTLWLAQFLDLCFGHRERSGVGTCLITFGIALGHGLGFGQTRRRRHILPLFVVEIEPGQPVFGVRGGIDR